MKTLVNFCPFYKPTKKQVEMPFYVSFQNNSSITEWKLEEGPFLSKTNFFRETDKWGYFDRIRSLKVVGIEDVNMVRSKFNNIPIPSSLDTKEVEWFEDIARFIILNLV